VVLVNQLKEHVKIQVRTATLGATGETVTWKPVETRFASVIPLDAKARATYQQLQSKVSHKIVFRGDVKLDLGCNHVLWRDKILKLVEPVQRLDGVTIVGAMEE